MRLAYAWTVIDRNCNTFLLGIKYWPWSPCLRSTPPQSFSALSCSPVALGTEPVSMATTVWLSVTRKPCSRVRLCRSAGGPVESVVGPSEVEVLSELFAESSFGLDTVKNWKCLTVRNKHSNYSKLLSFARHFGLSARHSIEFNRGHLSDIWEILPDMSYVFNIHCKHDCSTIKAEHIYIKQHKTIFQRLLQSQTKVDELLRKTFCMKNTDR